MNEQLKAKWVEALRSGNYKQAKGTLCIDDGVEKRFCCLGVAEDILPGRRWEYTYAGSYKMIVVREDEDGKGETHAGILTATAVAAFGLTECDPTIGFRQRQSYALISLSGLNDEGCTFEQIAQVIERCL